MREVFLRSFEDAKAHLGAFVTDAVVLDSLVALGERTAKCFLAGGKVMIAGNGGSMADAIHFAEEWTGRFRDDRRPYPAMALGESAHLSCVANDYGFEHVFSRPVEAFGKPEDILILLSTSGNSANLLRAAEAGRRVGVWVVGFLGRGGGKLLPLCDSFVMAPGATSDRIQELHMMALHILIEAVEAELSTHDA
jgi:D-sedoheptulose 7-phosphate isomerase